jgi:hypothetical protein
MDFYCDEFRPYNRHDSSAPIEWPAHVIAGLAGVEFNLVSNSKMSGGPLLNYEIIGSQILALSSLSQATGVGHVNSAPAYVTDDALLAGRKLPATRNLTFGLQPTTMSSLAP